MQQASRTEITSPRDEVTCEDLIPHRQSMLRKRADYRCLARSPSAIGVMAFPKIGDIQKTQHVIPHVRVLWI